MREHRLEVADVFRQHGEEFLKKCGHSLSPHQRKALRDIGLCRTAALGGHVEECDHCSGRLIAYNSCRNRHCPKCQSIARDEWLAERAKELLPVPYCHVVFTLPQQLAPLALQNQRVCYSLLFRAVSETLQEIAADPRHLGAKIGVLAVLHTWSQTLIHHPHVHCIAPAGGLSSDRTRWIGCRPNFFLPVRVLSRMFRGKFLAFLRQVFVERKLKFFGDLAHLADPARFHAWLRKSKKTEWVVYAKPPFGGPEAVLKYLARYTHRVAISSRRLLSLDNGRVTFCYRDSKAGDQKKSMTLDAIEFIRRFLLHILPSGFVKIRHFGFLSNRTRRSALALCRKLLSAVSCSDSATSILTAEQKSAVERRCPSCRVGTLRVVEWLSPDQMLDRLGDCSQIYPIDSS